MSRQPLLDYDNPEISARQSIAPNASCDIDGEYADVRNLMHLARTQEDRIAALEAQLAERVRVKPLVWKELPGNQHCNIAFTADTIGGSFVIEERAGDTFDLWRMGQEIARRFSTLDEAKAAAQDWHNNAVAEVLEATPAPMVTDALMQVGWAYQDQRWDENRWHLCRDRPKDIHGRKVTPVYVNTSEAKMTDAREIIARANYEHWNNIPACTDSKPWDVLAVKLPGQHADFLRKADAQLAALHAAGFRIVGPEEDTAMGVVNMLLCVDFDRFTEHDQVLLESVLADARALEEKQG